MRLGNRRGRAVIIDRDGGAHDLETVSGGRFGADPQDIYGEWDELVRWFATADLRDGQEVDPRDLDAPVPRPDQVFAIGLNYRDHAAETGHVEPSALPPTFTKFPSCLSGPLSTVELPPGNVDWEVELVVIVGRTARGISRDDAWSYVAGVTGGQDLSERVTQLTGPAAQFSLGKSYDGFGPTGPFVVTPDELDDPDAIDLECAVNGETVQRANTRELIFSVPHLLESLSAVVTLRAGDLVFTGTPGGVGNRRTPQRFLRPGDVLSSRLAGVGELQQSFVAATERVAGVSPAKIPA